MSRRAEFTKETKAQAYLRCNGHCECHMLKQPWCNGGKIVGTPEYHHLVEAALGGTNDLSNCACLSPKCHRTETSTVTVPTVSKAVRISEKRMGLRKSSRGFRKAPEGYDSFNRRWRDE